MGVEKRTGNFGWNPLVVAAVVGFVVISILGLVLLVIAIYRWDERSAAAIMRETTEQIEVGQTVAEVELVLEQAGAAAPDVQTNYSLVMDPSDSIDQEPSRSIAKIEGFWLKDGIECSTDVVFESGQVVEVSDEVMCRAGYYF